MKSYLWIGCLALALVGCGSRPEPAAAPDARPPDGPGPQAAVEVAPEAGAATTTPQADLDRSVAEASASPGKPRAPVEAGVVGRPVLQSGVPGKVTLEVRPGVAVDGLSVQVAGDAALTVVGQGQFTFGPLAAAEAVRIEVSVTPTSGGIGRLSALLTLDKGGQQQARPVTLTFEIGGPVTLQAPAEKPVAAPVQDSTGELVHSIPAETTVGRP